MFSEASNMIIEGLKVRLAPASALEHKEAFTINLHPRILYLPKDIKAKVLPDGSIVPPPAPAGHAEPQVVVDDDGAEIILLDGVSEEVNLPPLDTDTGLPQTGIDINTGLPVSIPQGVEFIDPVSGKKQ